MKPQHCCCTTLNSCGKKSIISRHSGRKSRFFVINIGNLTGRITEYPKLEESQKDHQFQLLAPHRTHKNQTTCRGRGASSPGTNILENGFFLLHFQMSCSEFVLYKPHQDQVPTMEQCPALPGRRGRCFRSFAFSS